MNGYGTSTMIEVTCSACSAKNTVVEGSVANCSYCDTALTSVTTSFTADSVRAGQRQQEYKGKIIKCPNCGEVLKSFTASCPACGYEVRDAKASNTVSELARKLEAIEATRKPPAKSKFFSYQHIMDMQTVSSTDAQKISLIQSFPIPNTKEDIFEFMFLASSIINTSSTFSEMDEDKSRHEVALAWLSKLKHVYAKASQSFGNDDDFSQIIELYDSCMEKIGKKKKSKILKWVLLIGWIPLLPLLIFLILFLTGVTGPQAVAREVERLEAIVVEIESSLENGEYRLALMNAESIEWRYSGGTEERRRWDIRREHLIDTIIARAAASGIELERTPVQDAEPEASESSGFFGGFAEGFESAISPGLEAMQEGIDDLRSVFSGMEGDPEDAEQERPEDVERHPAPLNITLVPSGKLPSDEKVNFTYYFFGYVGEIAFYQTPDIIFTTTAAENGLGETLMYIRGTIERFGTIDGLDLVFIRTDSGMMVMNLPFYLLDFGIAEGLLTAPTDIDLLEIDHEYGFFWLYTGFSGVLEMPVGILLGLDIESIP